VTSDLPPSDAIRPRSATTNPCHRPRIVPASQMRSHHDQRATAHHGILASCPLRRPRCQPVLPRPQRATTYRRGRAAQPRPKAHSAAAHPASICPSSARAHPHACWNATGCAMQAAAWTAELCTSEPTLVPQSRADTPSTSNRRHHITSHATALRADQRHRARAVLAPVRSMVRSYLLTSVITARLVEASGSRVSAHAQRAPFPPARGAQEKRLES
jgi:hypothetical protein